MNPHKLFVNQIQQHINRIVYYDHVGIIQATQGGTTYKINQCSTPH